MSRAATAAVSRAEARRPSSSRASSRVPKHRENTTPLPMHSPSSTEVKKVIRAKAEPTAPKAAELT